MSDTTQLEKQILAEIAAAADETALEAVRVAALGKQGSITALLKTLGAMAPEQRKSRGAADQRLEGPRQCRACRAPRSVQGRGP